MTTHEFPIVLSTSTPVTAVRRERPASVASGGDGRPPAGRRPIAGYADGAWFVPDQKVQAALEVVRASGVASVCARYGRGPERAGLEGVLAAMILTAAEGFPMTVSSFTRMLHRGVSPRMRELLGAGGDVEFRFARARVTRLLHMLVPWGDSSGGYSGPDRAFLDGMTGRLLEAAWLAQPASVRDQWPGDVAFGDGFIAPAGRRTARPSGPGSGRVGTRVLAWSRPRDPREHPGGDRAGERREPGSAAHGLRDRPSSLEELGGGVRVGPREGVRDRRTARPGDRGLKQGVLCSINRGGLVDPRGAYCDQGPREERHGFRLRECLLRRVGAGHGRERARPVPPDSPVDQQAAPCSGRRRARHTAMHPAAGSAGYGWRRFRAATTRTGVGHRWDCHAANLGGRVDAKSSSELSENAETVTHRDTSALRGSAAHDGDDTTSVRVEGPDLRPAAERLGQRGSMNREQGRTDEVPYSARFGPHRYDEICWTDYCYCGENALHPIHVVLGEPGVPRG